MDGRFTGEVRLVPERLEVALHWRKPRMIFVNSMSDLFHDEIPDGFIARVFAVMALARQHTFQVLTKRHGRMRSLLSKADFGQPVAEEATEIIGRTPHGVWRMDMSGWTATPDGQGSNLWSPPWPLPNVWVGVSVENQKYADIRVPALLDTPAAVRFLACEPLLGPLDLRSTIGPHCPWCALAGTQQCPLSQRNSTSRAGCAPLRDLHLPEPPRFFDFSPTH